MATWHNILMGGVFGSSSIDKIKFAITTLNMPLLPRGIMFKILTFKFLSTRYRSCIANNSILQTHSIISVVSSRTDSVRVIIMRYSYYMVSQLALVVRHFLIFMKIKILWLLLATHEQEQNCYKPSRSEITSI